MKLHSDAAVEILKSSTDAIVVVGNDGDIILANSTAENLFGYEPGELLGEKVEVLMPPAHHASGKLQQNSSSQAACVRAEAQGATERWRGI